MSNQQDPNLQPQQNFTGAAPAAPQVPGYTPAPGYSQAPGSAQAPSAAPTNTMAIVSMISSIIGWFAFGSLCIVGVILGHISLKQLKTSGEGGRGMALTGLIMGYIGIAGWVIGLIIFFIVLGIAGASIAAAGVSSAS